MDKLKGKHIVTVYLKGGHIIDVECDDWKFTSNRDGSFSGYSFKGMKKGEVISFSIPDIVAFKSVALN